MRLTESRMLLACVGIGFIVRLVPELLAGWLPIGFDTVHYAAAMKGGVIWDHWSTVFTSTWLLYALIVPLYKVFQGDPFLLLKIVAPLLFGLTTAGIYWFARRALSWSLRWSVIAGVFFALQLASLRIGWDLLRNALGLGLLLFAMSYAKEVVSKRGFALFTLLCLLSVFAHEYSSAILLFSVLGLVLWKFAKRKMNRVLKRLFLGILPALSVFLVRMTLIFYPIQYSVPSNVLMAGEAVSGRTGVFFLVDYLRVQNSVHYYPNYLSLFLNVGLLFAVLFLPYLFFVVKGFFRNEILDFWTVLLLLGAFGCLVVPVLALQHWHRWMFMLVYPFTFYAVSGLGRLVDKTRDKRFHFSRLASNLIAVIMVLLTFGLGVSYLATPVLVTYAGINAPYIGILSTYFSVAPAVPYQDVMDVKESMDWLEANMGTNSCLVLHHVFLNWGKLCLDDSIKIVYSENSPKEAVSCAVSDGFSQLYFVWWNRPIGWYGDSIPDGFVRVEDFGRISVYVYKA